MGTDKVLKNSFFGGFKKEDVINYIEQLQQEIVSLKREAGDNAACKRELDSVKLSNESYEKEILVLKEENAALKAENANLIEKNASYSLKLEEAQVTAADYEAKLESSKEKIEFIEHKYAELEAEYSKISDIKKLVENAKSSVADITGKAKNKVASAQADIISASDRIKTVCVNFDSSAASLKASTENLLNALSRASEKLDSIGTEEE